MEKKWYSRFGFYRFQFGHIVWWNITFLTGFFAARQPPITLFFKMGKKTRKGFIRNLEIQNIHSIYFQLLNYIYLKIFKMTSLGLSFFIICLFCLLVCIRILHSGYDLKVISSTCTKHVCIAFSYFLFRGNFISIFRYEE